MKKFVLLTYMLLGTPSLVMAHEEVTQYDSLKAAFKDKSLHESEPHPSSGLHKGSCFERGNPDQAIEMTAWFNDIEKHQAINPQALFINTDSQDRNLTGRWYTGELKKKAGGITGEYEALDHNTVYVAFRLGLDGKLYGAFQTVKYGPFNDKYYMCLFE